MQNDTVVVLDSGGVVLRLHPSVGTRRNMRDKTFRQEVSGATVPIT